MGGNSIVPLEEKPFGYEKFLGSFYGNLNLFNGEEQHITNDGDELGHDEEEDTKEERTMYWKSQEALLEEILALYNSTASKLREVITKHVELARETHLCDCLEPKILDGCIKCLRQRVVDLLRTAGFNATLYTSMWKKTHKIPGGKHEYIEVMMSTRGRMKQVPFLIELEFRDQFKMAKSCEEYCELVDQLPEIYIGKPEHLNAIIRVVCDAAKRSTSEKRMHMGPWRKRSFMQRKWSAASQYASTEVLSSSIPPQEERLDTVVRSAGLQFSTATAVRVA